MGFGTGSIVIDNFVTTNVSDSDKGRIKSDCEETICPTPTPEKISTPTPKKVEPTPTPKSVSCDYNQPNM